FYANTVALYDRQFAVLNAIILFLVVLGVSNSVNMTVLERMGEFGTMRALGNRAWHIVKLIIVESALLGCSGAVLGFALGATLALTISTVGIAMPPPPNSNIGYLATIAISPQLVAQSMAIGAIATLLAAVTP